MIHGLHFKIKSGTKQIKSWQKLYPDKHPCPCCVHHVLASLETKIPTPTEPPSPTTREMGEERTEEKWREGRRRRAAGATTPTQRNTTTTAGRRKLQKGALAGELGQSIVGEWSVGNCVRRKKGKRGKKGFSPRVWKARQPHIRAASIFRPGCGLWALTARSLQISLNAHSCNYLADKGLNFFRRGGFARGGAADRAGAAIDAVRAEQAHDGEGEVMVRKRHQGTWKMRI